jgi:hypothetical protein
LLDVVGGAGALLPCERRTPCSRRQRDHRRTPFRQYLHLRMEGRMPLPRVRGGRRAPFGVVPLTRAGLRRFTDNPQNGGSLRRDHYHIASVNGLVGGRVRRCLRLKICMSAARPGPVKNIDISRAACYTLAAG